MRVPSMIVSATVILAVLIGPAAPARAEETRPSRQSVEILAWRSLNDARVAHGLPRLRANTRLIRVARAHSAAMARDGVLRHSVRLERKVMRFRALGENVGVGFSIEAIHTALMESADHRRNILGGFTLAGIGAAVTEYEIYVTQIFLRPRTR